MDQIDALAQLPPGEQVLEKGGLETGHLPAPSDPSPRVAAYLNRLAASSRHIQFTALEWIARLSTRVYTAETMS